MGFFVFLGSGLEAIFKTKLKWWTHLLVLLGLTVSWEVFEHFASRQWTDAWSNVTEHPLNAWLMDPLSNAAGYWTGWLVARWSWKWRKRD